MVIIELNNFTLFYNYYLKLMDTYLFWFSFLFVVERELAKWYFLIRKFSFLGDLSCYKWNDKGGMFKINQD